MIKNFINFSRALFLFSMLLKYKNHYNNKVAMKCNKSVLLVLNWISKCFRQKKFTNPDWKFNGRMEQITATTTTKKWIRMVRTVWKVMQLLIDLNCMEINSFAFDPSLLVSAQQVKIYIYIYTYRIEYTLRLWLLHFAFHLRFSQKSFECIIHFIRIRF